MSKAHAMAFALLAIVTLANCASGRRPAETRTERARVVEPSAGTVTYKGRTIVFDEAANPPLLAIDGRPFKVSRHRTARDTMYATPVIAYAEFTSLWGMGKALVDGGMVEYAAAR
jgi:hypothetical protein